MNPWCAMVTLPLPCLAAASDGEPAVPEQLVGRWSSSSESCESETGDLTLRIVPDHVYHWKNDGPVRAVKVRGDETAPIAELSGEGETWLPTANFKVFNDGGSH